MRRRPKRRRKRKRSSKDARQLRFRTGNINAAGGQPATPRSRTIRTVACANLLCSATTCGDNASFNINDWSAPADPESTGLTFTIGGTANNAPSGHADILADTYDRVLVLNALYRFNIRFKGDDNEAQDYVFAYKFAEGANALLTHTAGTVGIDNWKDLRQTRGWVYKRFSATHSGGSIHPSAGTINIRIPNVTKLCKLLQASTATEHTQKDWSHAITSGADSTDADGFLLITVFTIDGVALSAGDIQLDVDVFQKVKVWKNFGDFGMERAVPEA